MKTTPSKFRKHDPLYNPINNYETALTTLNRLEDEVASDNRSGTPYRE